MGRLALGLIVNPVAGMGGSVGLKGTDTAAILSEARKRGAVPQAGARAAVVLNALAASRPELELLAAPGDMGEGIARDAGLRPIVVGAPADGETSAADTRAAAEAMAAAGARLIVFAGGDGTARDMASVLGDRVPVIGVPAGVKMHSAVYATSPRAAADLALRALAQEIDARPREVMDIDEEAFRAGAVSARLYGYLPVPYAPDLTQSVKAGGVSSDREALMGIAAEIAGRMEAERLYVLGPGTTTRAVTESLGLPKTLLGVDLVRDGAAIGADATEEGILRALEESRPGAIVVTPIGGQGHFLGRGNQQIGARVVRAVGLERLLVAATPEKIASLREGTLHVDTGDPELDRALSGWRRVITGRGNETVCRVAA
ncbi:MAG: ATP-NAD kinase family protein [Chloroflexota bacterium]|nr:ATP-NAD kinase family protein [Chloroflexota bacterium]